MALAGDPWNVGSVCLQVISSWFPLPGPPPPPTSVTWGNSMSHALPPAQRRVAQCWALTELATAEALAHLPEVKGVAGPGREETLEPRAPGPSEASVGPTDSARLWIVLFCSVAGTSGPPSPHSQGPGTQIEPAGSWERRQTWKQRCLLGVGLRLLAHNPGIRSRGAVWTQNAACGSQVTTRTRTAGNAAPAAAAPFLPRRWGPARSPSRTPTTFLVPSPAEVTARPGRAPSSL